MALRGAYRLPKEIGEAALRFIKDGMEPGQALGTARMLSNNPQDPAATLYTKDLMARLQKARKGNTNGLYPIGGHSLVLNLINRPMAHTTRGWDLSGRGVALKGKADKTVIPASYQVPAKVAGAERRLVAEVANAASAGDRDAFLQILADLGFREEIAKDLANRYVPEIIEYNPTRGELL